LKLAHPGRRVLLRARFDGAPIRQPLFEQPVLPLLPEVERQAESIDLGLKFR